MDEVDELFCATRIHDRYPAIPNKLENMCRVTFATI